ncbi:MAG: 16S rRNA (uracil(1498)-N(3))-methyltransferase [Deltaproteobacteria bacterium]|nr:16S rRNA (uracil(1498)-N(3))-methyltransferase [Deltaproteobacteria bacterium]
MLLPGARAGQATIEGDRFHYLARVLRLGAGDALRVFDGEGREFPARVERVDEGAAVLSLGPAELSAPPRALWLLQGLPKADKFEWVVQKGTELGATDFLPAALERCVVKLDEDRGGKKVQRWQAIAEEAARQCGRADVPRVHAPARLPAALASLPTHCALLVLDEQARAPSLSEAVRALEPGQPVALLVGPEGGLARAEVEAALARGGVAVTAGRRVLRTETAALVALAAVQLLDGQLG